MKFLTIAAAALASFAAGTPTDTNRNHCKPGTYHCAHNSDTGQPGWKVCNISRKWEYGGDCPPNTVCYFNKLNGSPYCVPPDFQLGPKP